MVSPPLPLGYLEGAYRKHKDMYAITALSELAKIYDAVWMSLWGYLARANTCNTPRLLV